MAFSNTIEKYALYYCGKRSSDIDSIAQITLYNSSDQVIWYMAFYRDGQPIPDSSSREDVNPKRAYLRMHERQIDSVVDMLRNEKPCSLFYHRPTFAYIHTGLEPMGEEAS